MAEEVGSGYISLLPSLRGFSKRVKAALIKEMRGVDVTVPVTIEAQVDRKNLAAQLAGKRALKVPVELVSKGGIGALKGLTQKVRIEPDESYFRARLAALTGGTSHVTQKVKVDTDVDKDSIKRAAAGAAGDAGVGASRLFTSAFGSSLLNPLIGIPAAVAAAMLAIPAGAAVAATTLAGAGLGAIFLGAFGLRNDAEVKAAASGLMARINKTLTDAAQPLKGPILEAMKIIGDAFVSIGPDLKNMFKILGPAVPELARGFSGFLKSFAETGALEKFAKAAVPVLGSIAASLPDIGNALSQFLISMADVGPEAADFIGKFLRFTADAIRVTGDVVSWLAGKFEFFVGVVKWVVGFVGYCIDQLKFLQAVFSGNSEAVSEFGSMLWGWVQAFVGWIIGLAQKIRGGVGGAISGMITTVKAVPGKILSALGNLSTLLLNAGKNLIQGLIDGIKSKFGALSGVAGQVAGIINDYLQGRSPTKKGPLSGSGWTYESGQAIASGLAGGMQSELPRVASAGDQLAAAVGTGRAGSASGSAASPIQLEFVGGDDNILNALKESIRVRNGGNVDDALGS